MTHHISQESQHCVTSHYEVELDEAQTQQIRFNLIAISSRIILSKPRNSTK